MGSGSIALPSSGFFSPFPHGTGSRSVAREYLALPDGPGRFTQDYSCPALLRIPHASKNVRVRGFHPLWQNVPVLSTPLKNASAWSYNPHKALPQCGFGLFPVRSPLLGESFLFSLPRGTKMFQFPRFASPLCGDNGIKPLGCPIRKSTGQRIFAPHRGLSQLITSFIASVSQGIHHAPLTTFFRLCNYPKLCQ